MSDEATVGVGVEASLYVTGSREAIDAVAALYRRVRELEEAGDQADTLAQIVLRCTTLNQAHKAARGALAGRGEASA